jgi:ribonuclease HI
VNGMILNADGSSLGNPGVSGFGGLLRNDAVLLVVYHGFRMAWEFGMLEMVCYSDSKTSIELIKELVND